MLTLSKILCGPILRRCDPQLTTVWLATSVDLPSDAKISVEDVSERVAVPIPTTPEKRTVRVGENLWIHLLMARPRAKPFPTGKLLAYQVDLRRAAELDWKNLVYGNGPLKTTFFLQEKGSSIRIMQGSCRKPYGQGLDALAAADSLISRNPRNLTVKLSPRYKSDQGRPAVLFLTGDQIYADDVEEMHFGMIRELSVALMGHDEQLPMSVATFQKLSELPFGRIRKNFTLDKVGFTTEDGEGHLLGLGEFLAMYLMVWSRWAWDPAAVSKLPSEKYHLQTPVGADNRKSAAKVRDMYESLPAVRRALANVPTYMIFDDHDVTDDWNMHAEWAQKVSHSVPGRRVVANALGAYWLCQGWGNDPDHFTPDFVAMIQDFCDHFRPRTEGHVFPNTPAAKNFVDGLWNYHDWHFAVPIDPPTVFADMRTERELYPEGDGPLLVSPKAQAKIPKIAKSVGHRPGTPIIIISPAPVFNVSGIDMAQTLSRKADWLITVKLVDLDWEQWTNCPAGKAGFLRFLIQKLQPAYCIFLSGEVHFGLTGAVDYFLDTPLHDVLRHKKVTHANDRCGRLIQLTSSALKNENRSAGKYLVKEGVTDLIPGLDVNQERWDIVGEHGVPKELTQAMLPRLSKIDWIEQGRNIRDVGTEAYAPIQGHCNLGVVTIEPGSGRVVHDFCLPLELQAYAPDIVEQRSIVSVARKLIFDPASIDKS